MDYKLYHQINETDSNFDLDRTIHSYYEENAQNIPDYIALVEGNESITYKELNIRANRIAHQLIESGLAIEEPVAVYLPRGIDFTACMIAVMKAGGCFVALETTLPLARIKTIMDDLSTPFILSDRKNFTAIETISEKYLLISDDEKQYSEENPIIDVKPNNLAYMIFTSGSTGRPKGVQIEHLNLVNLELWTGSQLDLPKGARVTQTAKVSFDASMWEFWCSLVNGYTMYFLPHEIELDFNRLQEWLKENRIVSCFLPTPVTEMFIEVYNGGCPELKHICAGGDKLHVKPKPELGVKLFNLYGPAECAVISIACKVEAEDTLHVIPPVGVPIANCKAYILDENKQLVPPGEVGEIYIGGKCVGRGYFGRDDLTEQAFFNGEDYGLPVGRIYKTGDLGKLSIEDGQYECLGRVDNQVKIRGYRIELGEIESTLANRKDINQCVAILKQNPSSEKVIVAYYSSKSSETSQSELKEYLTGLLPEYMVPEYYVKMEQFPLTHNHKIDRNILPDPDWKVSRKSNIVREAFKNQTEENIAQIWREVLKIEELGRSDDFYELGGHSLKAGMIVTRLHNRFNYTISLKDLLLNTTIAKLSELVKKSDVPHEEHILEKVDRNENGFPITYGQQGLWHYWQLDPKRIDYNIPLRIDIHGELSRDALKQTLEFLVGRYESLHTRFDNFEDEVRQFVNDEFAIDIPFDDLSNEALEEKEYKLQRIIKRIGKTRFDLREGNLYVFRLVKTSDTDSVLLMTIHHIITDGWSMGMFMSEFYKTYDAYLNSAEPQLEEVLFQPIDYAVWERRGNPKEKYPQQLDYWQKSLTPFPEDIELPKKQNYVIDDKHKGVRKWWHVKGERYRKLREFCNRFECSSFVAMMTILDVVLYKYTKQKDIVVGSPYANRNHTDKENIFGLTTNLLAHRLHIDSSKSFTTHLAILNETCTSNYCNSDYPFDQLIKDLGYQSHGNKHPLFQVMMVYQNYPLPEIPTDKTSFRLKEIGNYTSKMDLVFNAEEFSDEMECWFEFDESLYDESLIERMCEHFQNAMDTVLSNPEIQIKDIGIIGKIEGNKLLIEGQGPRRDYPLDKTYIELLNNSFVNYPDNIALKQENTSYTYKEFMSRIEVFTSILLSEGVKKGDVVGICMDRTPETIISIMSVINSGCAYLPINPTYPQDRLKNMLKLANVKLVISTDKYKDLLAIFDGKIIKYQADNQRVDIENSNLALLKPEDPAYVIFTSGSTGTPKGISVSHSNLINHNYSFMEKLNLNEQDNVLQFGNLSFDLSIEEIFPTFLCGATLVLRTEKMVSSFTDAMQFIEDEQISILDIPTAYWHEMVYDLDKNPLPKSVRVVIIGGEKAASEVYDIWAKSVKQDITLLNTYGPTETTIIATWQDASTNTGGDFLIGKPLPNTNVYVLDDDMQMLPQGVPGELHIGGAQVAIGYIGQSELTNRVFLNHKFSGNVKDRIYKTGDIVRFNSEGSLEFMGRKDFQVKIRGHRIEPEEVEANIRKLNSVRDSVVLTVKDSSELKLVAYYISESGENISISDLNRDLEALLPKYMIPHLYVRMDEFPHTSTGKIDRKGFPAPDFNVVASNDKRLPYTPDQELICNIIADVLGLESVGINENFFELGGNSILSMKVINQIGKAGLLISINDLFHHKDIEDLSTKVSLKEAKGNTFGSFSMIELQRGSKDRAPLYLLHSLPGDLLGYVNLIRYLDRKQPIYGLQALGLFDEAKAHTSVEEMAQYYVDLIKKHCPDKKLYLGGWCFGGNVAYEMARLLEADGFAIPNLFMIESWVKRPRGVLGFRYFMYNAKCLIKMFPMGMIKYVKAKLTARKEYEKLVCNHIQFLDQGLFANRTAVRLKNIDAILAYRMRAYNGKIILFSALHQDVPLVHDTTLGWPSITQLLDITLVEATHDSILKEPAVKVVANKMNEVLASSD